MPKWLALLMLVSVSGFASGPVWQPGDTKRVPCVKGEVGEPREPVTKLEKPAADRKLAWVRTT